LSIEGIVVFQTYADESLSFTAAAKWKHQVVFSSLIGLWVARKLLKQVAFHNQKHWCVSENTQVSA
jgi:hypothetical protein